MATRGGRGAPLTPGDPDLSARSSLEIVADRVTELTSLLAPLSEREIRQHLWAASRRYLLTHDAATIARHLKMLEPRLGSFEVRLDAERGARDGEWIVHVAALDRLGLLASIAGGLSAKRISLHDAHVLTWRSGVAIDVFNVSAPGPIDWEDVRRAIQANVVHGETRHRIPAAVDARVTVDNVTSSWCSIVEINARDRAGLLHRVASALSQAGIQIHQAHVTTREGIALDRFFVTGPHGAKVDAPAEERLRRSFAGKRQRRPLFRALRSALR